MIKQMPWQLALLGMFFMFGLLLLALARDTSKLPLVPSPTEGISPLNVSRLALLQTLQGPKGLLNIGWLLMGRPRFGCRR